MPSFQDSIFLFVLALVLFGPKRLPTLARELGKWVGEFRRASNEFKMQMEEELRISEQAERQKKLAEVEAAAPPKAPLPESSEPHTPPAPPSMIEANQTGEASQANQAASEAAAASLPAAEPPAAPTTEHPQPAPAFEMVDGVRRPIVPIATAGEVSIMPPATGLPTPRPNGPRSSALSSLLQAIPQAADQPAEAANPTDMPTTEAANHGN
jgi:sec-independent protein translocase protein TatB